jgi:KDO2-lipid IV(A) lauroyltransferase
VAGKFKTKVIRPTRDFLLILFMKLMFFSAKIFPRKFLLAWHGFLARITFNLFPNSKTTILKQLKMVFPEKSDKEIYKMGKSVFVNLGKTFTDYIILSNETSREQFLKYFSVEGEEYLKQTYEKGKGVLCLIPHTSGWEFSAIMPPVLGYKTSAVSREIKNPALNKLMIDYREKRGMKNISRKDKSNSYEKLIERLSQGECVIIMIDQDSKKIRGEFLQFFGMQAYTPLGCARLAMETGAAIVPMATFRKNDDTYLFKILPEVPLKLTGNMEYDLRYNTQIHNNIIESLIRLYPTQWVWMHKRWHTTPEKLKSYWENRKNK